MTISLVDGNDELYDLYSLQQAIGSENQIGFGSAQTATGTNQATALAIGGPQPLFELTTVAASTGVQLPVSSQGVRVTIANNGANTLKVYTNALETSVNIGVTPMINATAGATGVSLNSGTNAMFHCMTPGQWYKLSGT